MCSPPTRPSTSSRSSLATEQCCCETHPARKARNGRMLNVCGAHRQYKDMPSASGSWSRESIGIEDQSGSRGVQISYGTIPAPATAIQIPASCHVATDSDGDASCSQQCDQRYGSGTANSCACTFGCEAAKGGDNFEACAAVCDTQCAPNRSGSHTERRRCSWLGVWP